MNHRASFQGFCTEMLQYLPFLLCQTALLLLPHLLGCYFRQFLSTGFANQDSNLVISWLAAMLNDESFDGSIPLGAPDTVLFKQFIRNSANLESMIFSSGIATRLNLIPSTIRHGPYRQHTQTLALFEIGKQAFSAGCTSCRHPQAVRLSLRPSRNLVQFILLQKAA